MGTESLGKGRAAAFLPKVCLGIQRAGKRPGKNAGATMIPQVISIEGDGGSVGVLVAFFRLKGLSQDLSVYHGAAELIDHLVYVGVEHWPAVALFHLYRDGMAAVHQAGLLVLPSLGAV